MPLLLLFAASCAAGSMPQAVTEKAAAQAPTMVGIVLARQGDLSFAVNDEPEDQDAFRKGAQAAARQLDGVIVSETPESMVVSVPEARFDEAMEQLSKIGELNRREVTTTDQTLASMDLSARIKSQQKLKERLEALLQRAQTVEDVLKIETELGRVSTELESLKAQKRALDAITVRSNIYLHVEPDRTPGPVGWIFYGLYHGVKWLFVWD